VKLCHASIVAAGILIVMVGVALLMVVHVVGIDVVTHANLCGIVVVVRHDRGNQHGDADNEH
jgi:hypothetical protein